MTPTASASVAGTSWRSACGAIRRLSSCVIGRREEARRSKQDGCEPTPLGEPDPAVGTACRLVVLVDIQRHHGRVVAQRNGADRGNTRRGQPLSAMAGIDPDALYLARVRCDGLKLGLEDDLTVLDVGERLALRDQLRNARPIQSCAALKLR